MLSFLKGVLGLKDRVKQVKKDQFLIIILTGILLLVISFPTKKAELKQDDQSVTDINSEEVQMLKETGEDTYLSGLETKLEQGLSRIDGVGRVEVMITLKSGTEQIVLKDRNDNSTSTIEKDSGGGCRTVIENEQMETTIFSEMSDGTMIPYISQTNAPKIEGVTVICDGGESAKVRSEITEVVKVLFPIEVHKIKVVRMAVTKTNSGKETIER